MDARQFVAGSSMEALLGMSRENMYSEHRFGLEWWDDMIFTSVYSSRRFRHDIQKYQQH